MIISMRAYIHTGLLLHAYTDSESALRDILSPKNTHNFFLCFGRGSNLESSNIEFDALPIAPPPVYGVTGKLSVWSVGLKSQ